MRENLVLPDNQGIVSYVRDLMTNQIRDLLRLGPVQFVVSNAGAPLDWIPVADCYDFWKSEVKPRVADSKRIYLDDFPDGLAYKASLWEGEDAGSAQHPVVLLDAYH